MTEIEYLLVCLAEEAAEVQHRVMKALRFGIDEVQEGQSLTNLERIAEEVRDFNFISNSLLMQTYLEDKPFSLTPIGREAGQKDIKFKKYKELAVRLGRLKKK